MCLASLDLRKVIGRRLGRLGRPPWPLREDLHGQREFIIISRRVPIRLAPTLQQEGRASDADFKLLLQASAVLGVEIGPSDEIESLNDRNIGLLHRITRRRRRRWRL